MDPNAPFQYLQFSTDNPNLNGSTHIDYWLNYNGPDSNYIHGSLNLNIIPDNDAPEGSSTAILPNGVENQLYILSKNQLLEGFYDVDDDEIFVKDFEVSNGYVVENSVNYFLDVNNSLKEYTISFDDDYIIINLEEDFNGELKLNYKVTDDVDAFVNVSKSVLIDKVGTDEILFDGNGIITKPVDLNPDNNEISKFSPEGSATGIRVFSNNFDPLGDVIYKVKDDTYGAFDVNQETGVVYLSNPSLLKHIKNPNHEIIVEASSTNPLDNRVSYETFEIAVNEGITFMSLTCNLLIILCWLCDQTVQF